MAKYRAELQGFIGRMGLEGLVSLGLAPLALATVYKNKSGLFHVSSGCDGDVSAACVGKMWGTLDMMTLLLLSVAPIAGIYQRYGRLPLPQCALALLHAGIVTFLIKAFVAPIEGSSGLAAVLGFAGLGLCALPYFTSSYQGLGSTPPCRPGQTPDPAA